MKKHVNVLIGNFGSGKSELALNFAIQGKKTGKSLLVDLDIINPYFRSSDMKALLDENGVDLIKPIYAGTGVEGLSLPPDVYASFIDDHAAVTFDVGGDDTGSVALGQYRNHFAELESLDVLFVINPRRPLSRTAETTLALIGDVCAMARLNLTGLVNNGNLSVETSVDDLILGYDVVSAVSKELNIPVMYTTGVKPVLDEFSEYSKKNALNPKYIGTLMPIERYMLRDWDSFAGKA